jgi:glycosyltransferase involved in cell wall biosynthesis
LSTSGPRIMYVITDLEVGGVPLHLQRLAIHVRDKGYHPTVVSLREGGPVAASLREAGVAVRSCRARGGWDFRVFGELARLIRETRPELIHSFLFHANLASRRAAAKAGVPARRVVCELQTVEVERKWHLWVDRWTHAGCRFIIGNSPSVIEHLHRRARIPCERLRLVRGGIDLARMDNAAEIPRAAIGVSGDGPIIMWVGRLDPSKGLFHLIEAFEAVSKTRPSTLVLVGDGALRVSLQREIERRGLSASVSLPGTRSDVPSLLKAADVFAFPSRTEGLPNALLEAMAAGRAIVTTDVPGCRDLVAHEREGLLVPYGDTSALAAAILRLLGDRPLAAQLAAQARRSVERDWRRERMLSDYLAIYDQAVADR